MRNLIFKDIERFRYERKYFVDELSKEKVEAILKCHPAIFSEIYSQRYVNNIYFDTINMRSYLDNKDGVSERVKVRIRWYGDLFRKIQAPVLELKIKHNMHVGKRSYPLKPFALDHDLSLDAVQEIFQESDLPDFLRVHLKKLSFALLNRYSRRYFLSADGHFRVTLDVGLESYEIAPFQNTFLRKREDPNGTIIEFKYDQNQNEMADRLTNVLPFRVSRSSKYIAGLENIEL